MMAEAMGLPLETAVRIVGQHYYPPLVWLVRDKQYKYSMHPELIKANKGMAAYLSFQADFLKRYGVIEKVPDFTKEIVTKPLEDFSDWKLGQMKKELGY